MAASDWQRSLAENYIKSELKRRGEAMTDQTRAICDSIVDDFEADDIVAASIIGGSDALVRIRAGTFTLYRLREDDVLERTHLGRLRGLRLERRDTFVGWPESRTTRLELFHAQLHPNDSISFDAQKWPASRRPALIEALIALVEDDTGPRSGPQEPQTA